MVRKFFYDNGRIFLLDSTGALISAIMLGLVLPAFQDWIGLPTQILYALSLVAIIFSVYSLSCYWFVKKNRPAFLKVIMLANLFYCLATLSIVVIYLNEISWLGIAYFIGEVSAIIALVLLERKISKQNR